MTVKKADGTDRGLQRNLRKFYLYKVLFGFGTGVASPILVLYFLAKQISLTRFMVLMAALNFAAFASAIPSGIVADRLSRKASMLFGAIGLTISFCIMLASADFLVLFMAFLLWGVAQCFCVGIDSAFLYDSAKSTGRESGFQKIAGNASFFLLGATVAGNAFGGFAVARFGLSATFPMAAVAFALCIPAIAAFKEPPLLDAARISEKALRFHERLALYGKHLAGSVRLMVGNPGLLTIAFVQLVILRSFELVNRPFAQPVLKGFGFSASAISFLFVGFNVASAVAAKFAHLADKGGARENRGFVLMLALLLASLALFAYGGGGVPAAISIAGTHIVYGVSGPLLATGLNRRVASAHRATCLSVAAMAQSALAMVTGPLFGGLSDAYSLGTGLRILLWSFAPLIAGAIVLIVFVIRPETVNSDTPCAPTSRTAG